MSRLRVDTVPLWLKPFFLLWAWGTAILTYGLLILFRVLCRVKVEGKAHLPAGSHIYTIWHENLILYFIFHLRYRESFAWMNHPAWFMKPVHLILRFMGLKKLTLGSTGNNGKQAMQQVAEWVGEGYHTLVACDGPTGPYRDLKYGALEMSRISSRPVVPISFSFSRYWRWRGWDKKVIPFPFATITLSYGKPVWVEQVDDITKQHVKAAMS